MSNISKPEIDFIFELVVGVCGGLFVLLQIVGIRTITRLEKNIDSLFELIRKTETKLNNLQGEHNAVMRNRREGDHD